MGQVLHGCATTTTAIRRAIQHSQASLRALAKRYGINPKTVAKWRQRSSVADRPTGPKAAKSTVLSIEEEAVVVAFRRHTLLPLDDCLYALQATIPHLTRSSLHRCLQRHGISRLPDVEGATPSKRKFKRYPIGYFHIDIAEVQTAEGRLYLFVAIDRTSKFAFTELHAKATTRIAADFLQALLKAVPYRVHTVLTDNGTHFTDPRGATWSPAEIRHMIECQQPFRAHAFEYACALADIDHRLTKPKHPWTTDEVEYPFRGAVLFFARLRMTSRRRVGLEVKARPRCLHCRSSFEASADTRLPRLVQPWVNRLYAASARSPRWRSSRRDRARLYA
jgi:transposase-like protein